MSFSLSKCPPKPRTKKNDRSKSRKHVCHEKVVKKSKGLEEITLLFDELDYAPLLGCQKLQRQRRRRRSDCELVIPNFQSKTPAFDLSVLDSPRNNEIKPTATTNTRLVIAAGNAPCLEDINITTIPLLPMEGTTDENKSSTNTLVEVDSDDSDVELLRSYSVFRKVDSQTESTEDASTCQAGDQTIDNTCSVRIEDKLEIDQVKVTVKERKQVATESVSLMTECYLDPTGDRRDASYSTDERSSSASLLNESVSASLSHNETHPRSNPSGSSDLTSGSMSRVAKIPLCMDQLFQSLDGHYYLADVNSVTVKDIIRTLEAEFETSLDRKTRKLVKARLTDLISSKVAPNSVLNEHQKAPERRISIDEKRVADVEHAETTQKQSLSANLVDRTPQKRFGVEHVIEARSSPSEKPCLDRCHNSALPLSEAIQDITDDPPPSTLSKLYPAEQITYNPIETAQPSRSEHSVTKPSMNGDMSASASIVAHDNPITKPESKKRKRPRKNQTDAALDQPPQIKEIRKRPRKGMCPLCTTCPCTNSSIDPCGPQTLARTELEIEKALIKRQVKLEKMIDKHESDLDLVTRELKKRRRSVLKRTSSILQDESMVNGSRFLLDVDVWDSSINRGVISSDDVRKSQRKLFGKIIGGQPTLTQILGIERTKALTPIVEEEQENSMSQRSDSLNVIDNQISTSQPCDCLEEPAEPCERITWRGGTVIASEKDRQPIWSDVRSEKCERGIHAESEWDQIFSNRIIAVADEGFDALLTLFGADTAHDNKLVKDSYDDVDENEQRQQLQMVNLSQLSQSAQEIAVKLERKVTNNSKSLSRIEKACPNWKENVRFALSHRVGHDISGALENVRASRTKLDKVKEEFLSALHVQQSVLQLFEMSLSASLQRANDMEIIINSPFDASTDVESDSETVTEFSPLSQDDQVQNLAHTTDVLK